MPFLLALQVAVDPGFRVDPAWLVATAAGLLSTLTGTIAVLYRGQIGALRERITWMEGELNDRNERIDTLIEQVGRAANAAERSVSLVEKERAQR